ncbi:MAG: cadherin repeat domain-containing protein, partial [Alphaproteobacteria bacterium]|nr:cadherin repeat domain-containing protein [Alphaproteobacteria bacterium]
MTNLTATAGDGKLTVTWDTPSDVIAAPNNHFPRVRWKVQNTNTWLNSSGASGNAVGSLLPPYEIPNLANGTTYVVEIRILRGTDLAESNWASTTGTPNVPPPTVSLSASPNPVTEGSSVTVTATLSRALSNSVSLPLSVTSGTAESGDHGTLASITVAAGATTGTGAVSTNQDADEDHETFTVALGTLPSSVTAGSPSSVTVTISDDDASAPVTPRPTAPETAERSFRENVGDAPTAEARDIGAPVAATGLAAPVQYLLEGEDREAFTIGADSGQLRTRAGTVYDYEQRPGYAVVVRA